MNLVRNYGRVRQLPVAKELAALGFPQQGWLVSLASCGGQLQPAAPARRFGLRCSPMAGLGKAAPALLHEHLCILLEGRQEFLFTWDELYRAGSTPMCTEVHKM